MKKHVTSEHGDAWARWKNVNLNLVVEDGQCREKSKHRFVVGYGAITDHFGSTTPYIKEDLGQKKFMEDLLLFVAKGYMLILLLRINVEAHGFSSKSPNCVPRLEASGSACHS
jgi:hypothetical protein